MNILVSRIPNELQIFDLLERV